MPPTNSWLQVKMVRGLMVKMTRLNLLFVLLAALLDIDFVSAVRSLRIASPLQAFTIYDNKIEVDNDGDNDGVAIEVAPTTARGRFLRKFKVGLQAETLARQMLAARRQELASSDESNNNSNWAQKAAMRDKSRRQREEYLIESAYDRAIEDYERKHKISKSPVDKSNKYQFVGVINNTSKSKDPITWYARKKPRNSQWSVRLIHVNQQAVLHDLFKQGNIDIFAKYSNTGRAKEGESSVPAIARQYSVHKRSWKNLWNFSPKHFITDSSGMYWRERRLRPGLYTDGDFVYEASYRYRDGRNGMHRKSTLQQWLASPSVNSKLKDKLKTRLLTDVPDVILEE